MSVHSEQTVEIGFKKGRHRKKQTRNKILHLMEFYFSDSNIRKDRFMSNLLEQSEYVDVTFFLKFNKIHKLTKNINEVIKALKNSTQLELNEDNTKVKRTTPIREKTNEEECTIYVQQISSDASHEWMQDIFSEFGKVDYVSIPKYKKNNLNKGFAFVEFDNEEEAKAALDYFEKIGNRISSQIAPDDLLSIVTYDGDDNKDAKDVNAKKKTEIDQTEMEIEDKPANQVENKSEIQIENKSEIRVQNKSEIRVENNSEIQIENKSEIRVENKSEIRVENNSEIQVENKSEFQVENNDNEVDEKLDNEVKNKPENEDFVKTKPNIVDTDMLIEETNEDLKDNLNDSLKRKQDDDLDEHAAKKIKSDDSKDASEVKKKKKNKRKQQIKELGLQVLPKSEWRKLRNKYLNMQRTKMQQLKVHLSKVRYNSRVAEEKMESNHQEDGKNNLEFVPGVIVKLILNGPCLETKKLKTELLAANADLKYVDIPVTLNNDNVYLRFNNNAAAASFCEAPTKGTCEILKDDEEKQYWDKITETRLHKMSKSNRKQRGRDKLLKKAEKALGKHIRFEEAD